MSTYSTFYSAQCLCCLELINDGSLMEFWDFSLFYSLLDPTDTSVFETVLTFFFSHVVVFLCLMYCNELVNGPKLTW